MKKLFFVAALLCALSSSVWATDVLVSSVQIPNFNPTGIGSDRDIAVGVTNGSTTVTSAGQFRQWIGMRGFSLTIQGTRYSVANVVDANTLTLVSGYAGSSSSSLVTATWHKYIEVRLYVNLAFQPLNASYLVQAGTPDSANFYQRFYASVINENGVNKLFINSFTVDATTDAPVNNTAKYTIGFYRPDGSRLDYYKCGNVQQLSIPPTTPTTLSAICTYNQSLVIITDNSAYTKPQIDARFPSCTAGQLYYFAASGNVLSCLNVGTNLSISSGTLNATGGGGGGGGTIGGSGTANRIPLFSDPTTIANSIMSQVGTSEFKFAATGKRINLDSGSQLVVEYANEATTGTLSNRLAKLTGNPSRAILAGTSDTTGLIGVAVANAGTSGSAEIVTEGVVSCEFDGATTAGNYVGASTTTAGKCKDLGASPTGVQIIGRVLSTNGAAGTYSIQVFPGEQRFGGGGSITGSGTTNYLALWNSTSDLGSAPTLLYDAGTDPANPEYLVQDNLHISTTRPIAQLRFDTDQIILSGSATRTNATRMLTLKGKSGQTGDFIRATDSTSTALFGVDNVGNVRIRQLPYTWPAAHTTNGVLTNNGTGTLSWTLPLGVAGPTNAIQINNGGGALDGGSNATLDLLTSTISLGTASSQNGRLLLRNSSNASTTTLQPGAPASSVTFTLPATLPASAGCLQVDNTGVITQTGSACGAGGGSTVWSALTNPSADLSLSMTTRLTTFNWATGTSTNNLFNLTTDASANGTGYLLNVATGASATVKPLSFTAAGTANGVEMTTAGRLQAKGTGRIEATPAGVTNAIQVNNGGGLMDGGANAVIDLTTSTLSLGTASSQNGRLLLRNSSNANTTTIQPGAPSSSITFTLPATLPASAGCLEVSSTGVITQTGSACGSGGGAVSSVSNANGTLTISPTTGAVVASLNLGNANTWTANQTFGSGIARMTLPQITTGINDANGNGMLLFSPVASAVNAFTFTNSATATKPTNILELTGSDSNVSLHIKTKSSTYPNMGQVYLNTSGRYDRPALSFWDSGFGYLSQYGLGMKGGGSYLSLYAPSIKLGTNEASSGLINMSGDARLVWHDTNSAAEDCPPCTAVGFNKASRFVIGLIAPPTTPDDTHPYGATWRAIPNAPAQISATANNYNPTYASFNQQWATNGVSQQVTGLTFAVTQVAGQVHQIWNVGTGDIVIVNETGGTGSTAANRFKTLDGNNLTITPGGCANAIYDAGSVNRWRVWGCAGLGGGGGSGTVTSVAQSFTGGLISVSGSPVTTSGTLALTVAGTSGGIPYFSSASAWASSGALTANLPVIGGGAGAAPSVGTVSGNTTKFVTTTGTLTSGRCAEWDASGNLIQSAGACGTGAGGATTALDNLAAVAINTSLLPGTDNSISLGSSTKRWLDVFLVGNIKDGSGNKFLQFTASGSAVNYVDLSNAATTFSPTLSVLGTDSSVGLNLQTKGSGTFNFTINPSSTNTTDEFAQFIRNSSGTAANNIGASYAYYIQTSTTPSTLAGGEAIRWENATHASRTSRIWWNTVNSGTLGERMSVDHNGIRLPEISSAATPSTNFIYLYAKDNAGTSALYYKNDAGTEIGPLAAGGGGSTNPTSTIVPYNNAGTFADTNLAFTSNAFTQTITSINSTRTDGYVFRNSTAATNTQNQYSPALRFSTQGWRTTTTAVSQTLDWNIDLRPLDGTTNPANRLVWSSQVNGGGYTERIVFGIDQSGTPYSHFLGAGGESSSTWPTIAIGANYGTQASPIVSGFWESGGSVFGMKVPNGSTTGTLAFHGNPTTLSGTCYRFSNNTSSVSTGTTDTFICRGGAAATVQFGAADAASPVNQTLRTQGSRAGTDSNIAGANLTIQSGLGTGNAAASSLILRSPVAGSSGTTAQTATTGLTIFNGTAVLTSYTVANLPSASTSGQGAMAFVTDANSTTTYTTVAGGGSNKVLVISDGTNWIIH